MTTFKESVEGYRAHWEVSDPSMTRIDVQQFENRSSLLVTTSGPAGILEQVLFPQGDPVVIIVPEGNWKIEFSRDGVKYYEPAMMPLVSVMTENGPGTRLNKIIDGMTPFPPIWERFSKVA